MRLKSFFIVILLFPFLMIVAKAQEINVPVIKTVIKSQAKTDYSSVTSDPKLIQALNCLDGIVGEPAKKTILGNNLSKKPIKIDFKNLSEISSAYTNFDALGWKKDGQLYIYINVKHQDAPVEALASLLCHEAIHQDEQSSIDEETYGWTCEAKAWIEMNKKNPELNKLSPNEHPLVNRLNTLENMFIKANYTTSEIKKSVSTNPGYKNLPEYSPGYGE